MAEVGIEVLDLAAAIVAGQAPGSLSGRRARAGAAIPRVGRRVSLVQVRTLDDMVVRSGGAVSIPW